MSSIDRSEKGNSSPPFRVLRVRERSLIWGTIVVLACLVGLETFAVLGRGTGSSQSNYPPPPGSGERPQGTGVPRDPTGTGEPRDPGLSGASGPDVVRGPADEAPNVEFEQPSLGDEDLVHGAEAVERASAFATEVALDAADAAAVVQVIETTNAALESLDARLTAGEIDVQTRDSQRQREVDNQHLAILGLLGWQQTSKLYERLRTRTPSEP